MQSKLLKVYPGYVLFNTREVIKISSEIIITLIEDLKKKNVVKLREIAEVLEKITPIDLDFLLTMLDFLWIPDWENHKHSYN